jgi:selenocysteine lyase/cysteine desulfurase
LHPHNVGYHSVDKPEDHLDYDLTFRPNAGRFEEALVNFPGIWGLGAAVSTLLELGMKNVEKQLLRLTSLALEGLESKGYEIINSKIEEERSAIVSFRHCRFSMDELRGRLEEANINVAIRGKGIRVSPSIYNDEDDIEALLQALP